MKTFAMWTQKYSIKYMWSYFIGKKAASALFTAHGVYVTERQVTKAFNLATPDTSKLVWQAM